MDLQNIPDYKQVLNDLRKLSSSWSKVEDAKEVIYSSLNNILLKYSNCKSYSQNETFKKSILVSLENLILASLHEKIFSLVCKENQLEDEILYKKCCALSALKVTADQLGALEDVSIPLPATVVELASLDMHNTPAEKLTCFSIAFDLAMAELKTAIVDVIALNCDSEIPTLNVSDITPILTTILIQAKPMHIISNLYYIENFHYCEQTPRERECLLAFKTAVDKLKVITTDLLLPRSTRIYCDIGLEDVLKLTRNVDKCDRKGQRISTPNDPLERHIEHFTNLIAVSTLENR